MSRLSIASPQFRSIKALWISSYFPRASGRLRAALQRDGAAADAEHRLQIDQIRAVDAEKIGTEPPGKGGNVLP